MIHLAYNTPQAVVFSNTAPPFSLLHSSRCRLHDKVLFNQVQIFHDISSHCTARLMFVSRTLVRSHVRAQKAKRFLTASTSRAQSGSVASTAHATSQVCFSYSGFYRNFIFDLFDSFSFWTDSAFASTPTSGEMETFLADSGSRDTSNCCRR